MLHVYVSSVYLENFKYICEGLASMPRTNFRFIIFLGALAIAGYFVYEYLTPQNPAAGGGNGPMQVNVAEVLERDIRQWRDFSGRLVAVDSVTVRPRVSGTIEKIHFREGELVSEGQALFTIDQKPYAAALQAAQAKAALAEADFRRAKVLVSDKTIPQRLYDQRRNDVEVARADLTHAKLEYEYTVIKSPIAGRVSRAEVTMGNLVVAGPNAPVLTSVVSISPIYADIDVDEQTFVRFMQPASVDPEKVKDIPVQLGLSGNSGKVYEGHVQSFDNQINVSSGTIRVRAVFDNADGALIPGLFAMVRLADAVPVKSLLVAERAIGTDQSKKFVIIVKNDNTTERREVKLDGIADGLRIIGSGLNPGEKIIVDGMQRIMMPGQPVAPVLVAMDAPAAALSPSDNARQSEEKVVE